MENKGKKQVDYTLYLCTDRRLMTSSSIEECVEAAIQLKEPLLYEKIE